MDYVFCNHALVCKSEKETEVKKGKVATYIKLVNYRAKI